MNRKTIFFCSIFRVCTSCRRDTYLCSNGLCTVKAAHRRKEYKIEFVRTGDQIEIECDAITWVWAKLEPRKSRSHHIRALSNRTRVSMRRCGLPRNLDAIWNMYQKIWMGTVNGGCSGLLETATDNLNKNEIEPNWHFICNAEIWFFSAVNAELTTELLIFVRRKKFQTCW